MYTCIAWSEPVDCVENADPKQLSIFFSCHVEKCLMEIKRLGLVLAEEVDLYVGCVTLSKYLLVENLLYLRRLGWNPL